MTMCRYHVGDVFEVLATMPARSVDLVLTSPPFLALRSYLPAGHPAKAKEIGSEPTPAAFVDTLLDVVEALARVLAPHGSIVIELGDTYAGSGAGDTSTDAKNGTVQRITPKGCRGWPLDKSLALVPESFRWALAYGRNPFNGRETPAWRVRNVVRWHRPNPPVGALGDKFRPATSELVVACKARDRYFDLDAVRMEPTTKPQRFLTPQRHYQGGVRKDQRFDDSPLQNAPGVRAHEAGAPPLDTWVIPTHAFKGSHYATYPPDLCIRPILAMCPERVCRVCSEPSRRITTTEQVDTGRTTNGAKPRDRGVVRRDYLRHAHRVRGKYPRLDRLRPRRLPPRSSPRPLRR